MDGDFLLSKVRCPRTSTSFTHSPAGPEAAQYLQGLTSFDLRELTFGKCAFVPIEGFHLHVARGGYTGEDGFEVCPSPRSPPSSAKML